MKFLIEFDEAEVADIQTMANHFDNTLEGTIAAYLDDITRDARKIRSASLYNGVYTSSRIARCTS